MRIRSILFSLAATGMAVAPVAASAAPVANPAASLSVAGAARAHSPSTKGNDLFGGGSAGIFAIVIIAGIIAIGAIAISNEDDDPDSP